MKRLALILLLSGCVTSQPANSALAVSDVWARHHELDGKMVRVRGYVTECVHLGCSLKETPDRASKWLSIGTSAEFDDSVDAFLGSQVIVEGRLKADCLHIHADPRESVYREDGEPYVIICTDRASMIMDPRLVGLVK